MGIDWAALTRRAAGFSDADVKAAIAKAKALKGKGSDPNKIPTFWDQPKQMPTIADVDFGTVTIQTADIPNLLASNKWLKRDRLIWHIKNAPKAMNPSVFTEHPLVMETEDGNVIIDGHHRLAAQTLLGADQFPIFNLPST